MERRIIVTADGSPTLFVPELHETYHSRFGAKQESEHVYINTGLREVADKFSLLSLLEVGLGTGLNVLLTQQALKDSRTVVHYEALEPFPLNKTDCRALAEINRRNPIWDEEGFQAIHCDGWNQPIALGKNFSLVKRPQRLEDFIPARAFHLVYFDAFSPAAHPNLWTVPIFEKLFRYMVPGGVLVTYCSKGTVRRNLETAGFRIEKLPGSAGKKEITRACK